MANKKKVVTDEQNNFILFSKATAKTFILMIKNHFRSSSFYLGNLLVPIMVVLTCGSLFPINFSFIWMLFISTTFAGFSAYGTLLFVIRKSTIKKNFDMTATESSSLYFGMLVVLGAIIGLTMLVVLASVVTFDHLGLLSHNWSFVPKEDVPLTYIDWSKIQWITLAHYFIVSIIIVFSISFFFEQLLSTQKNFFIASFIYLLGGMFFSGIWTSSIYIDGDHISIITQNNFDQLSEDGLIPKPGTIKQYTAGSFPWFVGQVWPHFGLNQMSFHIIDSGWMQSASSPNDLGDAITNWYGVSTTLTHIPGSDLMYYEIQPFIEVLLILWVSGMVARYE